MAYSSTLAQCLAGGGIAVMRTDTIYGIVGRADSEAVVERIYQAKGRTPAKSPIVLIGDIDDMFDLPDEQTRVALQHYWPGPHSIILPAHTAPTWIVRDNASVAYRMPASDELRALLRVTGPLIAPSANPESLPPARTISEARVYFGELVDHYEDGGEVVASRPSSLYRYDDGRFTQLR